MQTSIRKTGVILYLTALYFLYFAIAGHLPQRLASIENTRVT
jgi:hypothetical protein